MIDPPGRGARGNSAASRLLLIERLDAIGADVADARWRAFALGACGHAVTVVVVAPGLDAGSPAARGLDVHGTDHEAARAVSRWLARGPVERVVFAGAHPPGGPLGKVLRGMPACWWPTALPGSGPGPSWRERWDRSVGSIGAIPSTHGVEEYDLLPGLLHEPRPPAGATHPLWDGALILAPEGWAALAGGPTLEAFARIAPVWHGVDMVAWGEPAAAAEIRARQRGVATRVHAAGVVPRIAEWAWWGQASAVVLTGARAIASGLLLRAFAAGCPVLCAPARSAFRASARALEARGLVQVAEGPGPVAAALDHLLRGGAAVDHQIHAARAFAASVRPVAPVTGAVQPRRGPAAVPRAA